MNAQSKRKVKGAPAWMVTFADLMALLFCLFVLLLSFAEVDSDSFKKNAGPMREAFGTGDKVMRTTSLPSIQPGESGFQLLGSDSGARAPVCNMPDQALSA